MGKWTGNVIIICLLLTLFAACGQAEYHTVDYSGNKDCFTNAKDRYRVGEQVELYFDLIATDVDYTFYIDGESVNPGYDSTKGYIISFTMPDHDVVFDYEMEDSMSYLVPEDEPGNSAVSPGTEETGVFDFQTEKVLLNSGWEMPIIGTGTWTLSDEEAENSTYYALKSGMRLIDTARYYQNETGVGKGLKRAIDEGIVTREDVFITSKIFGGDYDRAGEMIDAALEDLGVEYIDLMLIHQHGADDAGVYKAMEEAVGNGKIHSIGICNYYTKEQVDEVLSFAEITPAVIQNENHIYYQNAELREYVKQYGIVMESWYPFGGRGHTQENFENEVIREIAEAHEKTAAQIILRWHLQDGYIAIPGSSNPHHIAENYDIFDFELSEEEMEKIRGIDEQRRYEHW